MVKKVLNILLVTKMMIKLDLFLMFPKSSGYKKGFNEKFLIKDGKFQKEKKNLNLK